jgi:HlyD family secretion protein
MAGNKLPRIVRILLLVTVVLVAGVLIWWFLIRQPPIPHNIIALSGRIEGDDSAIAAKTAGRIREIRVREGDKVKAGDIIAMLDDEQAVAREQQARLSAQEADTRVTRAQQQIDVYNEQLKQARITVDQARQDAEGRVKQAEEQHPYRFHRSAQ